MARTTDRESGIREGMIITKLDDIESRLKSLESMFKIVNQNSIEISKLTVIWKIFLPVFSVVMGAIGFVLGRL